MSTDQMTDTPTADAGEYAITALSRIRISPDNRKRFNSDTLNELAASIKDIGVAQPILIRPVPPTPEQPEDYEIVAGERRFRASNIAGMVTIPTMIRSLTDLQAAKIRILENLQREDPHEMEEADGYQQLMLTYGYSADQLANEVKKSRAYIYGRLKLCALANDVREQFLDNKISASIALLIARIPTPKLQAKALIEVTEDRGFPAAPMSYRAAAGWIQNRYTLNLADAVFAPGDAKLMPAAGSCTACPKRSGNQPDVMDDLKNADVCTNPDCFAEKKLIHFEKLAATATKKGVPVHEHDSSEALAIRNQMWQRDCDLVKADLHLTYFNRNAPETKNSGTPLSTIGAGDLPPVATYIKSSDGTMTAWYKRSAVQAALEAAGVCETVEQHATRMAAKSDQPAEVPSPAEVKREAEFARRKTAAEKETSYRIALYRKLRLKGKDGFNLSSLREFAKLMVRDDNDYAIPDDLIGDVYPFETATDEAVCAYIDQASLAEVQLILVDLALGECLAVDSSDIDDLDDAWRAGTYRAMEAMAAHEGISPTMVRIDLEMTEIELKDLGDGNIGDFIRVNPHRVNELRDFIIAERPYCLSMFEAAALVNGFIYTANGFQPKDAAPVAAAQAHANEAPADPPEGTSEDVVAGDDEDIASAMAEPEPIKAPKPKKSPKKVATPAAAAPLEKTVLAPTAAWPFPKTSRPTPAN